MLLLPGVKEVQTSWMMLDEVALRLSYLGLKDG